MYNPVSTYRIQFHKNFTLADFSTIIPYLTRLGIRTVYASPILEAVPGSTHGYDGINPHRINPEIGDEEQLRQITQKLSEAGIRWLQDIVPNHMAFDYRNPWLMDVLEKGRLSRYSSFFDITWREGDPVMVPFLGGSLDEVVKNKEIKILFNNQHLSLGYYDQSYPLNPESYLLVLECNGDQPQEVKQVLHRIEELKPLKDKEAFNGLWNELLSQFQSWRNSPEISSYLNRCLDRINEDPEKILSICKKQHYRLCHWQETDQKINFRRFFTINGLICLNIQHPEVFQEYHSYIIRLLKENVIHGLRIDHIDGLFDPSLYVRQLREITGEETYIVVEKILEPGEELPRDWAIQGNSGYDFLSQANNLLSCRISKKDFTDFYSSLVENDRPAHEQIREKKEFILSNYMAGDLENLLHTFIGHKLVNDKIFSSLGAKMLKQAIAALLVECPIYRYYGNHFPLQREEHNAVGKILNRIRKHQPELTPAVNVLEDVLLKKPLLEDDHYNQRVAFFYKRCMQFTGPIMAKGVEDTLMYTYNRFLGHNEVGDSPESFGMSSKKFHLKMKKRQKYWPLSMNGTATHDTKRGEDASARLNVLTELSEEWFEAVDKWKTLAKKLKKNNLPDVNDEYFIYQTLIATYPMPGQPEDNYSNRLKEYLIKAFREAKRHTNWVTPNQEYETAVTKFAEALLDKKNPFRKNFEAFHKKICDYGIINSLTKVALKFTCPGVPDTYQGCEFWDLSMVDPDNRRPVNYPSRIEWLDSLQSDDQETQEQLLQQLWDKRYDASIKLWLIHSLLKLRNDQPELFSDGMYYPLEVKGKYKNHVLAFARRYKNQWLITALPLYIGSLCKKQEKDVLSLDWENTRIVLPKEAPSEWEHVLLKSKGKSSGKIYLQELFAEAPFGIIKLTQTENSRGAGVLLHITSLPSRYGVGDLGPEAKRFADALAVGGQKYWQLLPLNPTELGNGHSPYSSFSSMAGNTLLISPDLLVEEGLLSREEVKEYHLSSKEKAEYKKAEEIKNGLFQNAFHNFKNNPSHPLHTYFESFLQKENYWLHDFALYVSLKRNYGGRAWSEWPEEYKNRNEKALEKFVEATPVEIEKTKWLQFIFAMQWQELKKYCHVLNIQLFGDLPFYISYDSVDVWSNPDIFSLDENGKMVGVAGVPPDYFNADGQLWGMPVFRWDTLKKRNYDWWVRRIRKNMELYDLLRLDHFRAFADYWEVPASEKTAKNGAWKLGPGKELFDVLAKELGKLSFIAEDLGDISPAVTELRDALKLPGMKVLQFAFGDDLPGSIFIPHNYSEDFVAYTGTHDNNTTLGWYRENTSKTERKNLNAYAGIKIKEGNVHKVLSRMAYSSVAKIAVLPIQDVLGLDEGARMNLPASTQKNWLWRLKENQLADAKVKKLLRWVKMFNRR